MLYTMSIVRADGSETVIYGRATINVIEEFVGPYAEHLAEGAYVKVAPYLMPLADWEKELLAGSPLPLT